MSYDLNAFVLAAALPPVEAIRERLAANKVVIPGLEDVLALVGYVPATLDGATTGFELMRSKITDKDRDRYRGKLEKAGKPPDRYLEILTSSDTEFMFTCKADDPKEIQTARVVAQTLAGLSGGWFSDPQTNETRRLGGG